MGHEMFTRRLLHRLKLQVVRQDHASDAPFHLGDPVGAIDQMPHL
jgi:hypothetical protein